MKETIKHSETANEYYFVEGCYISELHNSPDDPSLSIARARLLPGTTTHWHRLVGICERYIIVQGIGQVEVGELAAQQVSVGDIVLIPPLCRQRISNIGVEDLVFLALCTPRFQAALYEDLETND